MGGTFYTVKGLIQKRFPDTLFDRLRDSKGPISLAPDPHQRRTASARNEEHKEPKECQYESDGRDTSDPQTVEPNMKAATFLASERDALEGLNERCHPPRRKRRLFPFKFLFGDEVTSAMSTLETIFDSMSEGRRRLYDPRKKQWRNWPKSNQQNENNIATILNDIVDAARRHLNSEKEVLKSDTDRVFCAKFEHDGESRKPDIVLIPRGRLDDSGKKKDRWRWISAVGEVKPNSDLSKKDVIGDLAEYGGLCFGSQRSRRFVLSFSLISNRLHLWKFDRSGVLVSEEVDVHKEPLDFLRVILGMALGDDYYLGLDPSFFHKKGGKDYVKLNEEEYEVVKEIHIKDGICGRGSVVLLVKDRFGNLRVMKDQWVDRSDSKEFDILNVLTEKNIDNVIKLIDFQYVHFKADSDDPVPDTTETDRNSKDMQEEVKKRDIETRDHYRILITPYGNKIESFRSLVELVSAFRDYIEVIKRLHENDIVHRDISVNNVVLVEVPGSPLRKGYLIDFDCAILHPSQMDGAGTYPFMAREVLMNDFFTHRYYHDIESAFYVLIFICLVQDGPKNKERVYYSAESFPLLRWLKYPETNEDIEMLGIIKESMLLTEEIFIDRILRHFSVYFKPLETLLLGLRRIIFDWDSKSSLAPSGEVLGEPKSIGRRNSESVFKEIDALFAEELAKLPDESQPSVSVLANKPRPPISIEAIEHHAAHAAEKLPTSNVDSVVKIVEPEEDIVASTQNSTGTARPVKQEMANGTKAKMSRGVKRKYEEGMGPSPRRIASWPSRRLRRTTRT